MGETGRINEKWMGMTPSGTLSGEDNAFLDRSLGRANESIDSGVGQQQSLARIRLAQRRIGGPAAEGVLGDIGASGLLARGRAAGAVADIGHGIYAGNQRFNQSRIMQGWNNDIGAFQHREQRKAQQQAAWANAIGSAAKMAGSYFTGGASLALPGGGGSFPDGSGDIPADGF